MPLPSPPPLRNMLPADTFAQDVVLIADGQGPLADALGEAFAAAGAQVAYGGRTVQLAPGDPASVAAGFDEVERTMGPVTVLLSSAVAPAPFAPAERARLDLSAVSGAFTLATEFARRRIADRRGGALLQVGRAFASHGAMGLASLATNQAGLEAQVRAFAAEWGGDDIRANLMLVGPLQDDDHPDLPDAGVDPARLAPAGRRLEPREVGWAATYLCSDYAAYISGATFVIDGAYSQRRSISGPAFRPVRDWNTPGERPQAR